MGNIISSFISVWVHPWVTMQRLKEGTGLNFKSSMFFVLTMVIISGLISAIWNTISPSPELLSSGLPKAVVLLLSIIVVPLLTFGFSFAGAFILWGMVHGFLKGSIVQYKSIYQITALISAFTVVNAILSPIPKAGLILSFLISLWALIVLIRGIVIVEETPAVRSFVILGLFFGLLITMGLVSQQALRQTSTQPNLSDLGDFEDFDEEAFNQQLQDLANQADNQNN